MLKTYLYVPEQLNQEINALAQLQKESKAKIIRTALEKGIIFIKRQKASSASVLLRIAEVGKKYKPCGPKDVSTKMDDYLWSSNKR